MNSFRLGAFCVAVLILAALLSLVWTPFPPAAIDVPHKLATPSARIGSARTRSGATSPAKFSPARGCR